MGTLYGLGGWMPEIPGENIIGYTEDPDPVPGPEPEPEPEPG